MSSLVPAQDTYARAVPQQKVTAEGTVASSVPTLPIFACTFNIHACTVSYAVPYATIVPILLQAVLPLREQLAQNVPHDGTFLLITTA